MSNLQNALEAYILDSENGEKNYDLARYYENIGQTSSAISFYLRAADRASSTILAYECLIRAGHCFNRQGNMDNTVKSLYKSAINLDPIRPEAYLCMARFYEWKNNYNETYHFSSIGLQVCRFDLPPLKTNVHDPIIHADYGLMFEKAVSSWWVGKGKEARAIFKYLAFEYNNPIDEVHLFSIRSNLSKLGSGDASQAHNLYDKNNYDKLRFKFKDSEKIDKNYSQVLQDIFILSALDGKREGRYLEIGSSFPFYGNNTALLEQQYNWKGIGIELDEKYIEEYRRNRSNIVIHENALNVNYEEILSSIAIDNVVDYLQLDCEPPAVTYEILTKIPFEKYKFAVITFEHDAYIDYTRQFRQQSRVYLESKGYELLVSDISPDGESNFEDWWIHPDLISEDIKNKLRDVRPQTKKAHDYFFIKEEIKVQEPIKISNFNINYKSNKRIFVVDDFYEDPDFIRNFALSQKFDKGGIGRGYIGNRTFEQFLFPGLKEKFEEIMQHKITAWEGHGMNGRFQVSLAGDPLVYHCDSQKWAGMLYLTPDAPFECGTTMWAHKKTRIRHNSHPQIMSTFRKESTLDKTFYEPVDVIGNVYNRLVIFDAGCIHSASEYFGFNENNCRLWHMFFFD